MRALDDDYGVREAHGPADREAVACIAASAIPERARSTDEYEYYERLYPGSVTFLAERRSEPVGFASVARIYVLPPEFDALWCEIAVLAAHRGHGVGSAFLERVSATAGAAGKRALHVPVTESRPESVAWFERRGFRVWERSRVLELDLRGVVPRAVDPPPGVEIVALAVRRDLLPGAYAVAREAFPDIPGAEPPSTAGAYEEWVARDVDSPRVDPEGFFLAVADDRVVGYACLSRSSATPELAWHDMTGVARAYRGRGIAAALKRATIAWAAHAGLERLCTDNDVANAPMRAINTALGYAPLPDELILRGPLAGDGTAEGPRSVDPSR